ncbi:hypothetical protein FA95DRAFT_1518037 [Auriscalpium vulgare]|uniref:Uncharacterized protein n=1 Tax=Auriscalpium vulgare TaxID=40419 RepID=A0ACB8RW49_9AGAM|nr:hypothetical protein FA95DRAFT_1518037 [Auriscalpium vulgare]
MRRHKPSLAGAADVTFNPASNHHRCRTFHHLQLSMNTAAGVPPGKGKACAECRRSKLKCDREFPCQSCIRRGCGAICPDGTLAATKGNKVLMAHAQKLTEQVKTMSTRIRELEAALEKTQCATSTPHPLLRDAGRQDPLADISDLEARYEADLESVSENMGSLAIGWDGKAKYYGETAGAEYLQSLMPDGEITLKELGNPKRLGLPFEVLELVHSFPFGHYEHSYCTALFNPYLPSRERATQLAELYYANIAWMYDPIPRGDFERIILQSVYQTPDKHASLSSIHAHSVSVFFMVLALGSLFDHGPTRELVAEQYHALGRAAFALESIVRGATCATSQALFLMVHFLYQADRSGNERRWLLMGLCAKVAQMIGLQRDSAGWNLEREEVQRRRTMFWEFYTWDAWSSVVNGRPPALNLGHSDCRFPDDLSSSTKEDGSLELGFHAWKFRYSAACLSISVQRAFAVQQFDYPSLLHLDKRIRTFPIPSHLRSPGQDSSELWNQDPTRAMQQYCVVCECESNLLYIHRSYFAQALRESEEPLQHKYSQSVMAAYRSALVLIASLKNLNTVHPKLSSRVWYFWSGFYTSCVLLGAIVIESPGSKLARNALAELNVARPIYEEGSELCRPPATMAMLDKLHARAHAAFTDYHTKLQYGETSRPLPNDGCRSVPDELDVIGGRTSVITKSAPVSPHASTPPSPDAGSASQSASPEADPSHVGANMLPLSYVRSVAAPDPGAHAGTSSSYAAPTETEAVSNTYNSDSSSAYAAYFDPAAGLAYGYAPADASQPAYQAMQVVEAKPSLCRPGGAGEFAAAPRRYDAYGSRDAAPVQPLGQSQYKFYQPLATVGAAPLTVQPPVQNQQEIWWKFVEDLGMSS